MPPPHLHPRSRMTSSLFATTVFASFFVVALPHILPCPAPRVKYADGEMPPEGKRRRRRKPEITETPEGNIVDFGSSIEDEGPQTAKTKRECPVPKPGGAVGELLGFKKTTAGSDTRPSPDRTVR
ncbi:hypothetical protein GE09DRAFT_652143 [Coniochaeta sp. 2T2.1]|nr:hypothetical protein GE09DRAFT_652143 [Coniochaeta sp. 2T2.1]